MMTIIEDLTYQQLTCLFIYIYSIIYNNKRKDYNPKVTYNIFYRHTFHNKDVVKGK